MRIFLVWSVAIWLLATVVLRLVGQFFFATPLQSTVTFLITIPAMVGLSLSLTRRIAPAQRFMALASLAIPAMLLDTLSVAFVGTIFPNLPLTSHPVFAAWLLWAYTLVFLSGFLPRTRHVTA